MNIIYGRQKSIRTTLCGVRKKGTGKIGTGKMGTGKMGTGKMGTGKIGTGKMVTGKMGTGKMGTGKMSTGKMGTGKKGTVKKEKKKISNVTHNNLLPFIHNCHSIEQYLQNDILNLSGRYTTIIRHYVQIYHD